jgi:hypothetical protein
MEPARAELKAACVNPRLAPTFHNMHALLASAMLLEPQVRQPAWG